MKIVATILLCVMAISVAGFLTASIYAYFHPRPGLECTGDYAGDIRTCGYEGGR